MQDDRENRIHERAHAIWEQEGRPEGRHADHWIQAEQETGSAGQQPQENAGSAPAPSLSSGDDAAPGTPGTGEDVCPECQGSGQVAGSECRNCGGTGIVNKGIAGG